MKEFEELKSIWDSQAEKLEISPGDILKKLKKSRRSFANKLLAETIIALVLIILLAFIWIKSPFIMWTTHLAMFIFISGCFYYIFFQYRDYKSIQNNKLMLKQPGEYLEYLKSFRMRRYALNTRKYSLYAFFIGFAFALFLIEVYFVTPLWQTILALVLIIGWFLLCWFLMRNYIRREEEKLETMIANLERLQKQFQ